jgi:hypothetical protein
MQRSSPLAAFQPAIVPDESKAENLPHVLAKKNCEATGFRR